jgi:hypothetical protein
MKLQASDFSVTDIVETVIETVIKTRNTTLDVKTHIAKMILYRDFNINMSLDALKRRLVDKGELQ